MGLAFPCGVTPIPAPKGIRNSLIKQWGGGANLLGGKKPCHPFPQFVSGGWESLDNGAGLTSEAPHLSVVGGTIES